MASSTARTQAAQKAGFLVRNLCARTATSEFRATSTSGARPVTARAHYPAQAVADTAPRTAPVTRAESRRRLSSTTNSTATQTPPQTLEVPQRGKIRSSSCYNVHAVSVRTFRVSTLLTCRKLSCAHTVRRTTRPKVVCPSLGLHQRNSRTSGLSRMQKKEPSLMDPRVCIFCS